MSIDVTCRDCFYEFSVSTKHAGKSGRCPDCGAPIQIPRARPSRSRSSNSQIRRPSPSGISRRPASSRRSRQEASSDNRGLIIAGISAGGVVLLLLVGIFAFRMGSSSSTPAETATDQNTQIAATTQEQPPATQTPTPGTPPDTSAMPPETTPIVNPTSTTDPNVVITQTPVAQGNPTPVVTTEPEPAPPTTTAEPEEKSLADLIEEVEPSVVRIDVRTGSGGGNGSGFVVDKQGTILTNYHVIAGAEQATVVFADGEKLPVAGILRLERNKDIAVLKVNAPPERFLPLPLATAMPRKGESVFACGAPFGLSFTASEGIISALRTSSEIRELGVNHDGDWIQTTAPISPGNSGGPLINKRGQVVAANTMQLKVGQNLNFGISSLDLQKAYDARSTQITPLNPSTAPADASDDERRETVVDATKDERGRRLLAKVNEVTLVIASFSFDPTGEIEAYLKRMVEGTLKSADIEVIDTPAALLLVTMELERAGSVAGAKGLKVSAHLLVRDNSNGGRVQVVKVWEDEESVGTFSPSYFARGMIPTRVRTKVTGFFRKFISDKKKAENEFGNR